jgi:membrane protein DedA with SNARE-associated domain
MIEQISGEFGYAALFLGTFFEGESALLIAGFAAHEQYLRLPLVMLTAFAGSFCGSQMWFELARRYGLRWIERHPHWIDRLSPVSQALRRRPTLFILGARFVYGLRFFAPLASAVAGLSPARFAAVNAMGAALWSLVIGSAGYLFGAGIAPVLRHFPHMQAGALFAGGMLLLLFISREAFRSSSRLLIRQPQSRVKSC